MPGSLWPIVELICWRPDRCSRGPRGARSINTAPEINDEVRGSTIAHETEPVAYTYDTQLALPRANVGRRACAENVSVARLDGRFGIVPVPGRLFRARLVRDCSGLARFRAHR